jgi:hypothetical protein
MQHRPFYPQEQVTNYVYTNKLLSSKADALNRQTTSYGRL